MAAPTIVVIGWDAADWNIMRPLIDQGMMPSLKSLIDRGVSGNLTSLTPMLSPLLWNSIATGHYGDRHGILGFVEPRADGSGLKAVSSTSRKCKAIWNMLDEHGMRSNIINWFASHPAEQINGVFVSNLLHPAEQLTSAYAPIPHASVYPQELAPILGKMRVSIDEILPTDLQPFLPKTKELDATKHPLIHT
ncbi:MAG: alkaline phosphatase family protein, partial [Planctomycetota bacterium]